MQTEPLATHAPQSVAHHGATNVTTDHEAQTMCDRLRQPRKLDLFGARSSAIATYGAEQRRADQALRAAIAAAW